MAEKYKEADRIIVDLFEDNARESYGAAFDRIKKAADSRARRPARPDSAHVRMRGSELYQKLLLKQDTGNTQEEGWAISVQKMILENSAKKEIQDLSVLIKTKSGLSHHGNFNEKENRVIEQAYRVLPHGGMPIAAFSRAVMVLMKKK